MALYPKINDESILLDNECKKMLRRTSKKKIIDEVSEKLFNKKKKHSVLNDSVNDGFCNIYGIVLYILGCYN